MYPGFGMSQAQMRVHGLLSPTGTSSFSTGEKVKYLHCVHHPVPPSTVFAPDRRASSTRPITAYLYPTWHEPIRKPVTVVVFEDVPEYLSICIKRLRRIDGVRIPYKETIHDYHVAISLFRRFRPEIVITDMSLRPFSNRDGIDILNEIRAMSPATIVALATCDTPGSGTLTALEIEKAGFDAVFNKGYMGLIADFVRMSAAKMR